MPQELAIAVVVVIAALAIALGYLAYRAEQQRKAELEQLARQRGWQWDPSYDYSHDERFGHFAVFNRGKSRYAYNTLRGAVEVDGAAWPVQLGDYHYETTSHDGKRTRTHHHRLSYVLVEMPFGATPDLYIRAENFLDRIAEFIGFDDIDFESAEFSRRFIVKSRDKRFAYDVIHPPMMEFLLAGKPPTIELGRGCCCLTRGEGVWKPAEFELTADWARQFFERWPRHLLTQLSAGPTT
ncbi:MAG: hypothetical protein DCC67_14015 [Planctomycetota bacterium]|nr:MAG: hypothetical protein DCC67_14015 [Planctomycetota bacterium]